MKDVLAAGNLNNYHVDLLLVLYAANLVLLVHAVLKVLRSKINEKAAWKTREEEMRNIFQALAKRLH